MELVFDKYKRPQRAKMYVATPSRVPICPITGIKEETVKLTRNVNNTYTITFVVTRFIDIDGQKMATPSYDYLDLSMRIYVENLGWFILETPVVDNDGMMETKTITAQSAEIEMLNHDLTLLKINNGTTDSYEMMVEGNVDVIDDVEFAKEQILFYRPDKPELSLLNIVLKVAGMYEWSVGTIDNTPKKYKYYEDGVLKERSVRLSDEVGYFNIESQNLYAWFTQEAAQFFNCIFEFDFKNFKINAYRPENYGKDTSINIGFRNIQNSNNITIDDANWYTRYYVSGGDDLGIEFVNFGHQWIENIEYFLNTKYLRQELIDKYRLWTEDVEKMRPLYIEQTKLYNEQLYVVSELYDRVPLDGCSTDWSTFTDEELTKAEDTYEAQIKLLNPSNSFLERIQHWQIKEVIIPSINIEWHNRQNLTPDDDSEYVNTYLTNWELYGLDELQAKLDSYQNTVDTCTAGGYNKPYSSSSMNTESYHNSMYEKYTEAQNQLNASNSNSCKAAYNQRKSEIDSAEAVLDGYDVIRKSYAEQVEKENWVNGNNSFTETDLADLSHCYRDGVYENSNMFLVSTDDAVTAIDEQLKLLSAAQDDLYTYCMPVYKYTTDAENFLSLYEYEDYTKNLELGDFVWLGVRDDYTVKLRVMSLTYNPYVYDKEIEIEFSNMLRTRSGRNDVSHLLNSSSSASKGSRSGGSSDYLASGDIALTPTMIKKIQEIASNQIIANGGSGGSTDIPIKVLNDKMIQVIDITGENAFFDYIQSKLIVADEIVANSAEFQTLDANLANIKHLLAGNMGSELGQFINLTAQNTKIDAAVIRDLIAAQITVSMLKAGNITLTDDMQILSENGLMVMNGETLQIMGTDSDNKQYVAIQLGYNSQNKPSLIIRDETGAVMLDADGLHDAIVPDQFIKTDMVADKAITEDKIDKTNIVEWTDDDGNKIFDVSKFYYGDDKFEVSYTSTIQRIEHEIQNINNKFASIELNGQPFFKETTDGVVHPESITVTAVCKNGAEIGAWYLDGVYNDDLLSADRKSITIPPYMVTADKPLEIKVIDRTNTISDIFTIYYLADSIGDQGEGAISVIISTDDGLVFPDSTTQESSTFICKVYQGTTEIIPSSYDWQFVNDDGVTWTSIGHEQTITINIDKSIVKKRIKCVIELDETVRLIDVLPDIDDEGTIIPVEDSIINDEGTVHFTDDTDVNTYGYLIVQ